MDDIEGYGFFYESEEGILYVACLKGTKLYWEIFGPDVIVADVVCFWEPSIESLKSLIGWAGEGNIMSEEDINKLQHCRPLKITKNVANTICSIV